MSVAPSLTFGFFSVDGVHVASVKMSTSFKMKNRGNVPPRFETLRAGQLSQAKWEVVLT